MNNEEDIEINNGGSMKYFKYLTNITLSSLFLMSTVFGAVAINKGQESQNSNNNRDCTSCVNDYTDLGSECCDSAWEEFAIDCATLESDYGWDCAGCLCPGDIPCEDQGLITCEYGAIDGGSCAEDESGCLQPGECPAGQVPDCADDDCCPESWIGDGFEDCEDQAYGCDLTCYDNDGGDCAGGGTTDGGTTDGGTTTGGDGDCPAGQVVDCDGGGECWPESWIGDGFADCVDQAYGADLCCYDNDGGDCADSDCTTCEDAGQVTCWDGSCADTQDSCPDEPTVDTPGFCAEGTLFDYQGTPTPAVKVTWAVETVCGDGICNGDEDYYNCPADCLAPGECAEGQVPDCADDDCCPESWIGDGYGDCEDQAYGCDLTCYDNDGGDCAVREATNDSEYTRKGAPTSPSSTAVRLGQEFAPENRVLQANITLTSIAGTNAGFTNTWVADPAFGEFEVYGWGADDVVEATFQFCDGAICGDLLGPITVTAGSGESDCTEGGGGCPTAGTGDVNADESTNVLDIVAIVNYILGSSDFDDCQMDTADLNGDAAVNVLDIVAIVNVILDGRVSSDATSAKVVKAGTGLSIIADGFIGGVQMTLSHDESFSIDLTTKAMVADYRTEGTSTKLVVVAPEGEEIFTSNGAFEIDELIVANSETQISDLSFNDSSPVEVALGAAYPNPFNPVTSVELNVLEPGYVSVNVYNVMGQFVQTLIEGQMEANTYSLTWDGSNVPSGMYFVRAETATNVVSQKLMLVK
tara:strand:- start:13 stop:2268 length:2256 start_codon:yes stop_codon:yes gene_type:complete